MTPDSSLFTNTNKVTSSPNIHTTNGFYMHVTHIGNISTSSIHIQNAYLFSSLSFSLFYDCQFYDMLFELYFSNHDCDVQDPRTRLLI